MDKKYWEYAAELIREATGLMSVDKAVNELKKRWELNKGYLEPFFDDNGQRVVIMEEGEVSPRCLEQAIDEMQRIAAVIANNNPKYQGKIYSDGRCIANYLATLLTTNQISPKEFMKNTLGCGHRIPGQPKYFQEGTKVTKFIAADLAYNDSKYSCYGRLSQYSVTDAELLTSFALDVASQIMGILRVGNDRVILSINPVDFLMTSLHSSWTSCHNLYDGDWRTASFSFICDSVSAIAYATQQEPSRVDGVNFLWPKKNWRQMVYFDKDFMAAFQGNEYPSRIWGYSEAIRPEIADVLAKICGATSSDFHFISYHTRSDGSDEFASYGAEKDVDRSYIRGVEGTEWISCDLPCLILRLKDGGRYPTRYLEVSSNKIPCAKCGQSRYDCESSTLVCDDCDGYRHTCCCCDDRIEDWYEVDGRYYCSCCYEDKFASCEVCDTTDIAIDELDELAVYDCGRLLVCEHCKKYELTRCNDCGDYIYKSDVKCLEGNEYCPDCFHEKMSELEEEEEEIPF